MSQILKSDVITDLMRVIGCGIEIKDKNNKKLSNFDINNLNFHKIIITTDADVDGFQIRTLVLTMIYRLCPTLIKEGYVYIAETPLYEILIKNKNKEEIKFAYSEQEKNQIIKGIDPKKIFLQRSKGLGENDADMMWKTTMCPETRHLIRVDSEDIETMNKYFELFLGSDIPTRKKYIEDNGHLYMNDLDIN